MERPTCRQHRPNMHTLTTTPTHTGNWAPSGALRGRTRQGDGPGRRERPLERGERLGEVAVEDAVLAVGGVQVEVAREGDVVGGDPLGHLADEQGVVTEPVA